jgi:hypothetical protein
MENNHKIISNFLNLRPLGAEVLNADRSTDKQTEIPKLIVAIRNFFVSAENVIIFLLIF